MSDPQPRVDQPRFGSASGQQQDRTDEDACRVPAWDRERLIDPFQRIDGCTRDEAEQEIAAYERSFCKQLADPSVASTRRGNART